MIKFLQYIEYSDKIEGHFYHPTISEYPFLVNSFFSTSFRNHCSICYFSLSLAWIWWRSPPLIMPSEIFFFSKVSIQSKDTKSNEIDFLFRERLVEDKWVLEACCVCVSCVDYDRKTQEYQLKMNHVSVPVKMEMIARLSKKLRGVAVGCTCVEQPVPHRWKVFLESYRNFMKWTKIRIQIWCQDMLKIIKKASKVGSLTLQIKYEAVNRACTQEKEN